MRTILSNRFLNKYLKYNSDVIIFHPMHEPFHLAALLLLISIHLVFQEKVKQLCPTVSEQSEIYDILKL